MIMCFMKLNCEHCLSPLLLMTKECIFHSVSYHRKCGLKFFTWLCGMSGVHRASQTAQKICQYGKVSSISVRLLSCRECDFQDEYKR